MLFRGSLNFFALASQPSQSTSGRGSSSCPRRSAPRTRLAKPALLSACFLGFHDMHHHFSFHQAAYQPAPRCNTVRRSYTEALPSMLTLLRLQHTVAAHRLFTLGVPTLKRLRSRSRSPGIKLRWFGEGGVVSGAERALRFEEKLTFCLPAPRQVQLH